MEFERLEDRVQLSANASGVIIGTAFVDANQSGFHESGEALLPGIVVKLAGTTNQGDVLTATARTDEDGSFTFQNLLPGAYQVSTGAESLLLSFPGQTTPEGDRLLSTIVVNGGGAFGIEAAYRGLRPEHLSLTYFLSSNTSKMLPFSPPGSGIALGNFRANSIPTILNPLGDVNVARDSGATVIDLAAFFTDPDMTNSVVRFDTTLGSIQVELLDTQAPQTVANFFNYLQSDRYDNTIFHRLVSEFVLQGGGFSFDAGQLNAVETDRPVKNEFGVSNTFGTIAMAKAEGDPNSATSQFFFNLSNNSGNLDGQNGGFTVFGQIAGPDDSQVLNSLAFLPVTNRGGAFTHIPLLGYSGTQFPTDAAAGNFLTLRQVSIVRRDEWLSYSITDNTNPNIVAAALENNRLVLNYLPNQTGTADITIRATDRYGISVESSFTVTVSSP